MSSPLIPSSESPLPDTRLATLRRRRPSVARRLLARILRPALSRPADMLDRILSVTDAKIRGSFRRVEASTDAAPRHRFTAPLIPMRELSFQHLRLAEIRRLAPIMPGLMLRMLRSGRYYRGDLPTTRTPAPRALLADIEDTARRHGALDVAYLNEIRPDEIFGGLAVPAPGVIVFTVEMEPEPIALAPSFETFREVAKGYRRLAEIAEAICDLLQERGHAAYPGTALGGQTDYVALARRAGLGGIGFHGLLLSPDAGARVRIATVYTPLSDLPERGSGAHDWVQDFCRQCRNCARSCPPAAIYDAPRPRTDGAGTACIDHVLCRDAFARALGCAVCIRVCPFSTAGYATVKAGIATVSPEDGVVRDERRFRVAVVGAGAAGFFTVQSLLERTKHARVDLFERLPVPHGLVRYGVAPDHPEVRSKTEHFDRLLNDRRVRFVGNVQFGRDVSRAELLDAYDAVVYATGASESRALGVPGEHLLGSVHAPAFVGWVNGHPDHAMRAPPLDHPVAAVVGAGNVALDVMRVLASQASHFEDTDIAQPAFEALRASAVREIHLLARGGPERAAFTPRELRDLAEADGVTVRVDLAALEGVRIPDGLSTSETRRIGRNLDLLAALAQAPDRKARVVVHLRFSTTVVRIVGDGRRRVSRVAVALGGETESSLDCGLLVRAIGFRGAPLPGVPFDAARGILPSRAGRLLDPSTGAICPREYTAGWIRRGARGIIGTNKVDAEGVVERLLADLVDEPQDRTADLVSTLPARGVRTVGARDWEHLRREERLRGSRIGRSALRWVSRDEMLASLDRDSRLGGPP